MSTSRRGRPRSVVVIAILLGLAMIGITVADKLPVLEDLLDRESPHQVEWLVYQTALETVRRRIPKPDQAKFPRRSKAVLDVRYDEGEALYVVDSWFEMAHKHHDTMEQARFIARVVIKNDVPFVLSADVYQGGPGLSQAPNY